jgi:hypothetical protein
LDSTIEVDDRLIETYSSFLSDINQAKAKILKNSIIGNGKKLGEQLLTIQYTSDSLKLTIHAKSEYLKDTLFSWNKMELPTLVLKNQYAMFINKMPNDDPDIVNKYITYHVKGVGVVRTRIFDSRHNRMKNLDLVRTSDKRD